MQDLIVLGGLGRLLGIGSKVIWRFIRAMPRRCRCSCWCDTRYRLSTAQPATMPSHSSIGFVGFNPEKAKIAEALQLHLYGTIRVYDTFSDSVELTGAGQVQRSDSVHHVVQHSQIVWIEEKDAEALSETLLGSSSGLIHCMQRQDNPKITYEAPLTDQLQALPKDASLMLECLALPDYYQGLTSRFTEAGRTDIKILDCSVVAPSSRTKSSIWISGSGAAIESVAFLSKAHDNVHVISGGLGSANKLRLTSYLMEATHAVTAAEATGLASKAGIDANEIYSIIINAAGNSSAYEELVPHMLQGNSQVKPSIESLLHNIVSCSHQFHGERFYRDAITCSNGLCSLPLCWG